MRNVDILLLPGRYHSGQLEAGGRGSPLFLVAPTCSGVFIELAGKSWEEANCISHIKGSCCSYNVLIDFLE